MRVVAEEWSKTLSTDAKKELYDNKKHISHIKVMRDEQKQDSITGENLASGQAFVEFKSPELALYSVHYLNNLTILGSKGLIVDFSMEDQRALFKRKEKIEKWKALANEKKEQAKKERREERREEKRKAERAQ